MDVRALTPSRPRPRAYELVGALLAGAVALMLAMAPGASAGPAALGTPPRKCKDDYEHLSNSKCLVQSRALTFTISPHTVRVGEVITVTAAVQFDAPAPNVVPVRWSWKSLTGVLGAQLAGCGPSEGARPLISRCRYRATTPTAGWRVVELGFGTYQGGAISRDYVAILPKGTVVRSETPKPKVQWCKRKTKVPPKVKKEVPPTAVARLVEAEPGSVVYAVDPKGVPRRIFPGAPIYAGDVIWVTKESIVAIELVTGGRVGFVGLHKDRAFLVVDEMRVDELNVGAVEKASRRVKRVWRKLSKKKEPLEIECAGGVIGGKG